MSHAVHRLTRSNLYILIILLISYLFISHISAAYASPLINEVMPSNGTVNTDEDNDSSDWIEIYNQSGTPFNITGYGLSDDSSDPFKWIFPGIIMEPEQHLLVFASGKNRRNPAELHSNFKINKDGETLVLTKPSGTTVDSLFTGSIKTDISIGRIPDGGAELFLFTSPTPGEANSIDGFAGYAGPVSFSLPGDFYSGSVALQLTTLSPDAEIRYTLDSSEPNINSQVFSGGLALSSTSVLRARAYEPGKLPGDIKTSTYIVNYDRPDTEVAEYFITCKESDFDYIYDHYIDDIYIPATITYNGIQWSDVSMRIRGDSSREDRKKSLKLKFSGELFETDRDMLNFNAEYLDKSYISQYISSRLMRESGHPAFESAHARVYLNGEYLGLYLTIENIDEYFLEANGLDPQGNLYKATVTDACLSVYDPADSVWEKKTNEDSGIDDLLSFIDGINSVPESEYFSFANEHLDYDKMVNMVALNMLVANGSTYYHNYFMYHDSRFSNKWTMLPWDMDKSLGCRYPYDFSYQRSAPSKRSDNPFHKRAVANETISEDIRTRINEFSETIFETEYVLGIIDSLQTVLESSIIEDTTDKIDAISDWHNELNIRRNFARNRIANLNHQFDTYPRPFYIEPTPEVVLETPTLVWHPSRDPNNDPLTYTLTYGPTHFFDSGLTVVSGITDTTYTFPDELPPGTYYWKITATDGTVRKEWYDKSFLCEGFNHRNVFTIAENNTIPDEITGDIVLTKSSSPLYVECDITVMAGGSLTIESGVELIISEGVNILVRGALHINGTSDSPVIVRSSSGNTRWGALCFDSSEGVSSISHAAISGSSAGADAALFKGGVSVQSSTLLLENVRFENNLHVVYSKDGDLTVNNCIFADSNIIQHVDVIGGTATVENSEFYNVMEGDAIDYNGVLGGSVNNNLIVTGLDDGIDIGNRSVNITIAGNTIYGCADKGISIGEYSYDIDISRNIITTSAIGIAVKDSSVAVIDHNTLYENETSISAYNSSQSIPFGGTAVVTNTVISQSGTKTLSADDISSITVSYSLSDKEILDGMENIFAPPDFISPETNDFGLTIDSPAIGKGSADDNGNNSDIGALSYSVDTLVDDSSRDNLPKAFALGQNFPNPFNPMTTIPFSVPEPGRVTIKIYSITGQRVANVIDGTLPAGHHQAVFSAGHLPSGMYYYRIEAKRFSETKSMLLLK
jgi:hypothetical protein